MKRKFIGIFVLMITVFSVNSQEILFTSQLNCYYWQALDSIKVINKSNNNYTTTLYYPDTVLYLSPPDVGDSTGIIKHTIAESLNIQVYPNPFSDIIRIDLNLLQDGNTILVLYDILGRKITEYLQYLKIGLHNFTLKSCPRGYYLLQIITPQGTISTKLISRANEQHRMPVINYVGLSEHKKVNYSDRKLYEPDFPFMTGDILTFKAYSKRLFMETDLTITQNLKYVFSFYDSSFLTYLPIQNACSDSMKFLGGNCPEETVILINNQQDLEDLFGNKAPEISSIDFSTQSLLYIKGSASSTPVFVEKRLGKDSYNQYTLEMRIFTFQDSHSQNVSGEWNIAIITEKIPDNTDVCLFYDSSILINLPIQNACLDSMKFLEGNCPRESVIIINNQQGLEDLFGSKASEISSIDFSTQSLIYVKGRTPENPISVEKKTVMERFL